MMNGRSAGVGFLLMGLYLIYNNLEKSSLFNSGKDAAEHNAFLALGVFLLVIILLFLYKNLK